MLESSRTSVKSSRQVFQSNFDNYRGLFNWSPLQNHKFYFRVGGEQSFFLGRLIKFSILRGLIVKKKNVTLYKLLPVNRGNIVFLGSPAQSQTKIKLKVPKTLRFACHHEERMHDRLAVGGHLLRSSTCQLYIELVMLLIKYPASQHEPKMYTRCTHRSCMYRQEIDTI